MKRKQLSKRVWLVLALQISIILNCCTGKSSFESLLKEYSKFKEKQIAEKASKLLGKHSSLRMTEKRKQKNRQLTDKNSKNYSFFN